MRRYILGLMLAAFVCCTGFGFDGSCGPSVRSGTTEIKVADVITKGPWIDVRAYGAVCNGTTDDTAAITAALSYAESIGGGTVVIPSSSKITSNITVGEDVLLKGADAHSGTVLTYSGTDSAAITLNGNRSGVDNLWIKATGDATSTIGILVYGTYFSTLDHVTVSDFSAAGGIGISVSGSASISALHTRIIQPILENNFTGIKLTGGATYYASETLIDGGTVILPNSDIAAKGVDIEYGTAIKIVGIGINSDVTTPASSIGIDIRNGTISNGITILHPTIEKMNKAINVGASTQNTLIINGNFTLNGSNLVDSGANTINIQDGQWKSLLDVTGSFRLNSAEPYFIVKETDQALDVKQWDITAAGGVLAIRTVKDDYSVANPALQIARDGVTAEFVETVNLTPITDNTYYLGKNNDDTPLAWKGIVLKDQTNGKYYRIELNNGAVTIVDLTD